ncbi:MAG: GNAT family N-acetyltransferase [Caldilineaceae bacterium SB0665_bin_25]|nr:GNAT family N-acetyltransferase [Caldilineaceae bacterium SB0665_bin_25]
MPELKQPTIVTGSAVEVEALRQGFNRGFADYRYNMQMDPSGMRGHLRRSSIAPEDCAVLVAEEEGRMQGVGAALLAVRGDEGWCGGLSVDPAYRGGGWGRRLMEQLKRSAVKRGVRRILLEVLITNDHARSVYRQAGFKRLRELLLWERDPRQGPLPLPYERLEETDPVRILRDFYRWHELPMIWQRRARSLLNYVEQHGCIGLTIPAKDGAPVAYALVSPSSSSGVPAQGQPATRLRILDVAVDPEANLQDAARPLLQALQLRYVDARLTLMDQPADSRLNPVFASLGFRVFDRQYEMAVDLAESPPDTDQ